MVEAAAILEEISAGPELAISRAAEAEPEN